MIMSSLHWDYKIGLEGVAAELKENGYAEESVEKYLQLFKEITNDAAGVRSEGEAGGISSGRSSRFT